MITETELLRLMGDLESDRVERTVSTSNTDKFAQAICAFANDFPGHRQQGYLLIGVRDNGGLSGLKVTDDLLLSLGALRSDGNIQPMPALTISPFTLAEGEVAVVEVLPAQLPPVRYKGRVYLRVGPRRATAPEQEERILTERRIAHPLTFDALPCLGGTLADLSEDRFRLTCLRHAVAGEVIAENGRPLKQQLASLRFFDLRQDCPTNAGILVLADRPMHYLPGAYVHGDVTAESFPQATGYRNPIIAEASRVLGCTNRFGQGIARVTKALELNGNPPAEYHFDACHFTVTLRRRRELFD